MSYAAVAAMAMPVLASMFGPKNDQPSGPQYSDIMRMMNSPEMQGYRNKILHDAFSLNPEAFNVASARALAQGNRLTAQRGLGTSGAGLGFIQQGQNDLALKYAEGEQARRLAAYSAINGQNMQMANTMTGMANNTYDAQMSLFNNRRKDQAGFIQGIGGIADAAASAYDYGQQQNQMTSGLDGYGNRLPGYGGTAGYVNGAPISSGNYNYGSFGGY